jgi:membrane protein YdbS with pleckstrin-like domain
MNRNRSVSPMNLPNTADPATGRRADASGVRLPAVAVATGRDLAPDPNLLVYYALGSLLLGPFFWALLIPYFFRYRTLRYRFDDEGVSMRWGILFRREITLNYARIQDIHLTSNFVERWLGLARIQIQTASGNAGAEMTIEGLTEFEAVRDFLYSRMRGARQTARPADADSGGPPAGAQVAAAPGELAETLRSVAAELRALREELGTRFPRSGGSS